jgi:hypothetical protein
MLSTVPLPAVYAENSDSGVSVMQSRVSRPTELHRRPLAEPSVRLSLHSAPIR